MKQQLSFNNKAFSVILIDDEPWFNANEVATVLEFGNPRQAIDSHVDSEDVQKMDTPTNSGIQSVNYINESGLYALIFGSKKSSAKIFKKWVTSEVLPTLRKTGSYSTTPATPAQMLLQMAKTLVVQEQKTAQIERDIKQLKAVQSAITDNTEFFTSMAFARNRDLKIDTKTASKLSRKCTTLSKELGIMVGKVPDSRYGSVNSYHKDVLTQVFEANGLI